MKVIQWRRKVEGIRKRIGETRWTTVRVVIVVEAGGAVHRKLVHCYICICLKTSIIILKNETQHTVAIPNGHNYVNYLADQTVLSYSLLVPCLAPEPPQLYRLLYLKPALPQNWSPERLSSTHKPSFIYLISRIGSHIHLMNCL